MTIYIPEKLKVGFQERKDTYSKKLAYIIYYDSAGKLRKEGSWQSWRDKNIPDESYDNTPTNGFVLNKDVGGYSTGWNHRNTYTRIFDPRGFEFEITVPNLLYILENCSCIKGKGLEGDFVYAWDGTELLLLPTSAPEYSKITEFSSTLKNREKISSKTTVIGGTYLTKKNESWIYLGRFECFNENYYENKVWSIGKKYVFYDPNATYGKFKQLSGLNIIVKTISTECVHNYAEIFEDLEKQHFYCPLDPSKDEYLSIDPDDICKNYYLDYKGSKFTVGVSTYGCVETNTYRMQYLEEPGKKRTSSYWNSYSRYSSQEYKELEATFKTDDYKYRHTKEQVLELGRRFGFTYRKRYLRNGKEA